jgi:hypothetical protein
LADVICMSISSIADRIPMRLVGAIRLAAMVLAVVFGIVLIGLAVTVGHCSAFGGRCPSEPPPLWDDDVFGIAFSGAALGVGIPFWLSQPSKRRFGRAIALGVGTGFLVGLVARSYAAG